MQIYAHFCAVPHKLIISKFAIIKIIIRNDLQICEYNLYGYACGA